MTFYPMTFAPVLKDYLWGGRTLETRLGRALPAGGVVAESWEIAAHADGATRVENGAFAGQLLTDVHAALGLDLIGARNAWAQARGKFPLLVKLIDAAAPLSVQVHPDDAYALAHEGNELGKTEMWVVLHAEPGAELILGTAPGVTRDDLRRAIANNQVEPVVQRLQVQAGDFVCVPTGTLHAIMGGLVIAEIQQNSNTTYRVYDWGRVDKEGRPRPLHLARALDVINFSRPAPRLGVPDVLVDEPGQRRERLCHNRYFVTERLHLAAGHTFHGCCSGETLEIWGVLQGQAAINGLELAAVRFCLLPAALGDFTVTAREPSVLLRITAGTVQPHAAKAAGRP